MLNPINLLHLQPSCQIFHGGTLLNHDSPGEDHTRPSPETRKMRKAWRFKKMRPWIAMNNWINLNNHDPWCISDILSIFECFMVLQAIWAELSTEQFGSIAERPERPERHDRCRGEAQLPRPMARPGDQHPERLELRYDVRYDFAGFW